MNENQNSGGINCGSENQNSGNAPIQAPSYGAAISMRAKVDDAYARIEEEKAKRRQMVRETAAKTGAGIILPLTFIFGVLLCELVVRPFAAGVGLTIAVFAAYAIYSCFIIKREKMQLNKIILISIPTALLALSFAFNASFNGRTWMVLLLAALMMVLNVIMSGSTRSPEKLSADTVIDAAYSHIIAPFKNIRPAFDGLFDKSRNADRKGSAFAGSVGKVMIGLIISVPVVLILGLALVSADAVFEDFIGDIIDRLEKMDISFGRILGDIIVGILVCLFAVPLVMGLRSGYVRERKAVRAPQWLDPVIGATVAYAAGAVYLLFVGVQIRYFFPVSVSYYFGNYDFTNRLTLPENMTWSEYARGGFFELSGVIIASFIAIAFYMACVRRNEKGSLPGYIKAALTVIAACNIVMSVSAVMRMGLYTIWCGLTAKRIGVLMIIAVIAVSLAAVIAKLWYEKLPLTKIVAAAALCAAVCFGCMNVERVCAEVNVDRHIEQGTSIDICYLGNLSYAAAPAVERLMQESPDEDVRAAAAGIMAKYYFYGHGNWEHGEPELTECRFGELTLDHWRAYNMCLTEPDENGVRYHWVTEEMIKDYGLYAEWQDDKRNYERWNDDEFMGFDEFSEKHSWYYDSYYGW